MRGRGGAREHLQEVEGRALGRQQRARRTFDGEQEMIGGDRIAFGNAPFEPDPRIYRVEGGVDVGYAANDGLLPRDHGGPADPIRGYQRSRQITAADVLGQSAGDLLRQGGGEPPRFWNGGRGEGRTSNSTQGMGGKKLWARAERA